MTSPSSSTSSQELGLDLDSVPHPISDPSPVLYFLTFSEPHLNLIYFLISSIQLYSKLGQSPGCLAEASLVV